MRALLFLSLALFVAGQVFAAAEPVPTSIAMDARAWLSSRSAVQPAGLGLIPGPDVGPDWEKDDWDWVRRAEEDAVGDGRKSLLKAVAASALLPGLGERYVGHSRRATVFHVTEAVIWGTFVGYRVQGDFRRDRYEEFAQIHAGAPTDSDSEYYEHIGLWISLEEWHDIVRRDARLRFPDDPAAQAEFFETNQRYDEGEAWNWPDDTSRVRYRQLRSRSERSYRNGRLAAGAAIVNRLASMIDALGLARTHNRKLSEEARLELRVTPRESINGLVIGPVLSAHY